MLSSKVLCNGFSQIIVWTDGLLDDRDDDHDDDDDDDDDADDGGTSPALRILAKRSRLLKALGSIGIHVASAGCATYVDPATVAQRGAKDTDVQSALNG